MSTMTVSAGYPGRRTAGRPVRSAAAPVRTPRPAARLTRRGRLLVTGLVLLLLVVAAVLLTGGVPATAGHRPGRRRSLPSGSPSRPGETLWQIAERVAPGTDPRETVARILDLNGLQTAQVQVGTALLLPS